MADQATSRLDWEDYDADPTSGSDLFYGLAWAIVFSLPLWGVLVWLYLKVF